MATKSRLLSTLIDGNGSIKTTQIDSDAIGTSAAKSITAASGTDIYSSADTLPVSADNGDQALVTSTNRLYIYSNGGWYNIALINSTPYWITEADGSYALSTTGGATIIEILAGDSDGTIPSYTATTDSDFNQIATITQDSDSRWIVIPIDSENGTAIAGTGTITFKATDGVNLVSTLSTFSLTFTIAIENSAETTLLLKADTTGTDNQVDASTNTYTITETGNVTSTALSPYHPGGYSTYFDGGATTRLTLPSNAVFAFGTGAYTVEAWVYISTSTPGAVIFDAGAANGSFGFLEEGGLLRLSKYGTGPLISSSAGAVTANKWHHCAIVRSSTGANDTKLYVDGVLVGTGTDANNWTVTTTPSVGGSGFANYTINGYIRDLRIVKGTAVYTSTFTPPTETPTAITNTSLLTCHLPYIADGSSNAHAITVNGNTLTKRFAPYDYEAYTKADYGGSVYFDGAGDRFEIASAAATQFGTGEWTIEGWFYPYDVAATQVLLYGYENAYSSTPGTYELYVGTSGATTTPQINGNNGSWATSATSIASSKTFQYETWNHIVWSRSGNNLRIFVNGKSGANHAISASQTYDMKRPESQFMDKDGASGFRGYVSDLRVVKGSAVYTSDFTPPTAPLTAIANTELLTCTNKNDIWDVGNGGLLTKVGNATSSNTQRQFTTSSAIYFGGSGDRITVPYSQSTSLGSGDFTVEWWMRPTANATMRPLGFDSNSAGTWIVVMYSNGTFDIAYEESGVFSSSSSYSSGTWQHIAWTRSGSISRLFIDGILDKTNSSFTYNFDQNTSHALQIGYNTAPNPSQAFNGYLQDLRITRGVARYTTNFTPPTAEFEG